MPLEGKRSERGNVTYRDKKYPRTSTQVLRYGYASRASETVFIRVINLQLNQEKTIEGEGAEGQ
eukprot:SAG11_NODE_38808_length_249_cov_2.093333_1_plen_63_part_10